MEYIFGPVPSRRLGYSLGINHIPPKHCSYSCVYCQVGRTTHLEISRREFYSPDMIFHQVEMKIAESTNAGRKIDFLTLVPDGEPTLDINLGKLIKKLKTFGIPIAVISNSTLIDHTDVQDDLLEADWVSLKVDAINEVDWRRINRPHHHLSLPSILSGMLKFRDRFKGELVTETMLVAGVNDNDDAITKLGDFLDELQPYKSYLSIPTRPPAENWVKPPSADFLFTTLQSLSLKIPFIDVLFEFEDSDFVSTGNLADDILATTAVHPIREEALQKMVAIANADWSVVETLLSSGRLSRLPYRGDWFYLRASKGNDR